MTYQITCKDCEYRERVDSEAAAIRETRAHRWTNYHDVDYHERKVAGQDASSSEVA